MSDTFATALWAPDALFTAMRAGVDGANLHVRPNAINAAFSINRAALEPRPLLYGLMLFTRTLGPAAQPRPLHLAAARSLNLSAWAVQIRGRILHVLLIDKSSRTVRVDLQPTRHRVGHVQRLLAPSPYSRSGVTLNGQQLNDAGNWTGTPRTADDRPHGAWRLRAHVAAPERRAHERADWPRRTGWRAAPRGVSEHHRRVAVTQHPVLAVGLNRSRKH